MGFAKVYSAQTIGLDAHIVDVEVDLLQGLHAFSIVGLPSKAVEESRDRVAAAVKNCGYTSPKKRNQKVVIALAPADLKKEGPAFDLAIALTYLLAVGEIKFNPEKKIFLGELSLNGKVRAIKGVLPLVRLAKQQGFTHVFVPYDNGREAALINGIHVYAVKTLTEVINHLQAEQSTSKDALTPLPTTKIEYPPTGNQTDLADIKGNEAAKRGLLIAASGGHNLCFYGPPGTGKTMLARAFPTILPHLSSKEVLEVTSIHSIMGDNRLHTTAPFRTPHHTASYVSIVGGGTVPKPGEVTLAHRGVLFLDEFPEFDRRVIEALRQPLEDGAVSISRASGSTIFPAQFILLAAMNPCPCGNFGSEKECSCSASDLARYRRKLSGPIIDRIDMWIPVAKVDHQKLSEKNSQAIPSSKLRQTVERVRRTQQNRFAKTNIKHNANMNARAIEKYAELSSAARELLVASAQKLGLSARTHHRLIKLARTIADIEESVMIESEHILEALQYRPRELA
jgi:magnesium chelatase family protein